jgi:hypothetical protein
MKTKMVALLMLLLPVLFWTSCRKDNGGMNTGQMNVRMMDAPSPYNFDRVNIDIRFVEMNVANANGQSQWITLQTNAGVYNLLGLVNGIDTLIASGQVAGGHVEQIRFVLGENNSIVVSGVTYPMDVPSGSTSGLKLDINQNINPARPLNIFIDFDAAQSIVVHGNGSYSLKPVLHAFVESETGTVHGKVVAAVSPMPGVAAVIGDLKPVATTYANPVTGEFMLRGIKSGTYTLRVYLPDSDIPVVIEGVVVVAGQSTDVGLVHLPR